MNSTDTSLFRSPDNRMVQSLKSGNGLTYKNEAALSEDLNDRENEI